MSFEQAVLLITFNRPDTTEKVLRAIEKVQPKKLYVFSDGPRSGNADDMKKVLKTRQLFSNLGWDVVLKTKFNKQNVGCAKGVMSAINWVFQTENQLIILEDDCVPAPSFFYFCEQMLTKYNLNEKVMHIAGTRWNPEFNNPYSYLFSSIGHVWGWATWKRAWLKYDFEMIEWQKQVYKIKEALINPLAVQYWIELFQNIAMSKNKHTWDYQWQYTLFKENGIAIIPDVNLISNIGLQGVHVDINEKKYDRQSYFFNQQLLEWEFLRDPELITQNKYYDTYHMKNHFFKFIKLRTKAKMMFNYLLHG